MVDVKEKSEKHLTKKYRSSMKNFFRDWDVKVMSYVMTIIIMVAMIAATVAWFTHMTYVVASGIGITTASSESLKVEVQQEGFVEVKEGEEDSILADLDMPVFDNVEQYEIPPNGSLSGSKVTVSKLAPGVYGTVTLRLTALRPDVDYYKITPGILPTYIEIGDTSENAQSEIPKKEIKELLKGHIQFFQSRAEIPSSTTEKITINGEEKTISDYVYNEKYVFYGAISDDQPLTGVLEWDEHKNEGTPCEITLYWYWPYEYANLSSGIKNSIPLPTKTSVTASIEEARKQYYDWDRMQEITDSNISWNATQLYDYADTKIGTYVKSMKLEFKVEGCHGEENETNTTP